jgi:tetratricopeptide (TPR) repeat protein
MRSSFVGTCCRILIAVFLPIALFGQVSDTSSADELSSARKLYKQGEFKNAAAAFQKVLDHEPSPQAWAGLVESYLKLDDVKSAEDRSRRAIAAFDNEAAVHAARGDVLFRRGLIPEAREEYKSALRLDANCARALLGQGKIEEARALRHSAREHVTRAHELDPEDGDAFYEWAVRQPYPANTAGLEKHLAEFGSDPDFERHEREYLALLKALAGRKVWVLNPEVKEAEVKLEPLTVGMTFERRGFGVRVTFNDRASTTLLVDTGASGVTITRKFAEKIGATKLSDQTMEGVGKGGTPGYQAWVDKVTVGPLQFHDCFVHVVPQTVAEVDGLIGTDVFYQFLVRIDFPTSKLAVAQLPPAISESEDPPTPDFSPAYSFGHILLVPATADRVAGLFVLDSGSNMSTVTNENASHLNQMRQLNLRTSGVGGPSNSSYIGDGIALQFANTRRRDQRMISVDLRSVSKDLGAEISGQIGFSTLQNMRLLINYRDGVVKLEEKK